MEIAVQVKNITKSYKLYEDKWGPIKEIFTKKKLHKEFLALDNVSLDFPKGESIGILGKNGSGKSTLLKIITGIAEPTSGTVKVNGSLIFLDVSSGIDGELSGYDNIFMKGTLLGFTKEEMEEKVDEIIEFSELGEYIYQPVKTYSSGMRSKLGFAISVNVDPDILIVDEALAVGDAMFRKKCMDKMNQFKKEGKTIIYVSHDKNSVQSFCTLAAWLHDGKLIAYGDSKLIGFYYDQFMSKRKSLEAIQKEIKFNHSVDEVVYHYSDDGLQIDLCGYLYDRENPDNYPFKFFIRNNRTNQRISKEFTKISYEREGNLPENIKEKAGFKISISEKDFPNFFKPDRYTFEVGYKNDNNEWQYFPIWSGNAEVMIENGNEVKGKYLYNINSVNSNLFLDVKNHEKLQEQVNRIWFKDNWLHIEYVAFVRGYETTSENDVTMKFYMINKETYEEYEFPTVVYETEEITENQVFNPLGKKYNFSKFHVQVDLNSIPEGDYDCSLTYRMNNSPHYELYNLVWASLSENYPAEPYRINDKIVEINVDTKYLRIIIK